MSERVATGVPTKPGGPAMIVCSLRDWDPMCQFWNEKAQRECTRVRSNGSPFCTYHKNRSGA